MVYKDRTSNIVAMEGYLELKLEARKNTLEVVAEKKVGSQWNAEDRENLIRFIPNAVEAVRGFVSLLEVLFIF